MLQFDANANADANVGARVNGPLSLKGTFTLRVNVCICVFENNRSNDNKLQTQRMDSVPILCVYVDITIDTMLKFDANADANIDASGYEFRLREPLQL